MVMTALGQCASDPDDGRRRSGETDDARIQLSRTTVEGARARSEVLLAGHPVR
jgi:hypothetical protein